MRLVKITSLTICAALLLACGHADDQEELIDTAGLEGLDVGKEDSAGGSYVRVLGALQLGATKSLRPRASYQGYTFNLRSAADVRIRTSGPGLVKVFLYGPQRSNGSWGPLVLSRWADDDGARVMKRRLTATGRYLIALRPNTDGTYFTTVHREGGPVTQFCNENEYPPGEAGAGTNYYMGNVSSREEAGWRNGQAGEHLRHRFLREGSCGSQPKTCPSTRAPVCTFAKVEYENACEALVAARTRLGSGWNAGGEGWTRGACPR